jgi:hypothetical protein
MQLAAEVAVLERGVPTAVARIRQRQPDQITQEMPTGDRRLAVIDGEDEQPLAGGDVQVRHGSASGQGLDGVHGRIGRDRI